MSQRAVPLMIMQPMFPDGLWKLASLTKLVGGWLGKGDVDVPEVPAGRVDVAVPAPEVVAAGPGTVTVVVELPQPASSATRAIIGGPSRLTRLIACRVALLSAAQRRDAPA